MAILNKNQCSQHHYYSLQIITVIINIIHNKLITPITFQNTDIQRENYKYPNHGSMKDLGIQES